MKASDEWTVPLHWRKHDELHRLGDEEAFFLKYSWPYDAVIAEAKRLAASSPCVKIRSTQGC